MLDRSLFLKMFLKAQPPLKSYILSLLRHPADADDVFQEVCLVLWERFSDYDPRYSFLAWALGIARNQVLRLRKSRARTRLWLSPQVEEKLARTYVDLEDELELRRKSLRLCVAKLNGFAREILELRYEKGWSLRQIAEARRTTVNAVNKTLGKIRRFLTDCTGMTGEQPA